MEIIIPMSQFALPLDMPILAQSGARSNYRDKLATLLRGDLEFHGQNGTYATHNLHSFPAKFPPQLPQKFIQILTHPGDVVLDPMMGSGTTVLEAFITNRQAIGFDIDPLALLIGQAKVTPLALDEAMMAGARVAKLAQAMVQTQPSLLAEALTEYFDAKTREFVNYWFSQQSQLELMALVQAINSVRDVNICAFLKVTLSAIIISKSGGVSLARDLAHTRPHKVKDVVWRSPIGAFEKRLQQNLSSLARLSPGARQPRIEFGDVQELPLTDNSVDLIVTSPPYAANAIDSMRAHKFSLVWLGYPIDDLSRKRKKYIGGETADSILLESLPQQTDEIVRTMGKLDAKKGRVLHRYYSEATRFLGSMFRVLKPNGSAIVVVGTSTLRGRDIEIQTCLAEIGESCGFDVVDIATRRIDRNRRMMPARHGGKQGSQIEERMHEEYIIGYHKPATHQPRTLTLRTHK
jgi:DNA modification methylase